jgi:hypothetical protein
MTGPLTQTYLSGVKVIVLTSLALMPFQTTVSPLEATCSGDGTGIGEYCSNDGAGQKGTSKDTGRSASTEGKPVDLRMAIELPTANEVKNITASPVPPHGIQFREFNVPRKYIDLLLGALRPAMVTSSGRLGKLDKDLASLTVQTKKGKTIKIVIYGIGNTVANFTVDGQTCRRGGKHYPVRRRANGDNEYAFESILIHNVLREIYLEEKTGEKSKTLPELLEMMQQTRGEKPPTPCKPSESKKEK